MRLLLRFLRGLVPTGEFAVQVWITSLWLLAAFLLAQIVNFVAWKACAPTGLLWGLGLTASGFVLGFLFAIPKVVQTSGSPDTNTKGRRAALTVNTNLEQISDWLTKIVVGVTLVEIKSTGQYVRGLAEYMVKDSCAVKSSTGLAVLIFFGPFGFLAGYLLTRVYFSGLFANADDRQRTIAELMDQPLPAVQEGGLELKGDARRAAEEIKTLDPAEAAQKDIPLDALATAQLGTSSPAAALKTLESAITSDPHNPRLHYLRALSLRALGKTADAVEALQNARAVVSPGTDPALRDAIYNSLTFTLLFQPQGYVECERLCKEYLQQDADGVNGAIWVNLACAAGQAARDAKLDDPRFAFYRDEALSAIEKALKIDNKWLPRLLSLYRPTPQQKAAGEDDLEVFQGDKDFESVLRIRS